MPPTDSAREVLDYLKANLNASRGAGRDVTMGGGFSSADVASILSAMGPGVTGALAPAASAACGCGGGGGARAGSFGGYAPAGFATLTSTGPNSIDTKTIKVSGAMLAAGSVLVVTDAKNGRRLTEVKIDSLPVPIGQNGVPLNALNLGVFHATGLILPRQGAATEVIMTAEFNAASVAGDEIQVLLYSKGALSLVESMCPVGR